MTTKEIKEFRVLTVWQPWASLLVHKIKKLETRPGPTSWTAEKGVYLIHAASKWSKEQFELCFEKPFSDYLMNIADEYGVEYNCGTGKIEKYIDLPLGQIIGSVEVVECGKILQTDSVIECSEEGFKPYRKILDYTEINFLSYKKFIVTDPEYSFGDYREGRYAWLCQNQRLLKNPIPYKGGQGYYQRFKGDVNQLEFL
jgi:hypothetical protein